MNLVRIGYIETSFETLDSCPKNTRFSEKQSVLHINESYEEALLDIDSASHIIVLYWLDKANRELLQIKTVRADGKLRGVFAIRTPNRPNPIGIAVVELISRNGTALTVSGLDCLNNTPILDLKPYIATNDAFPEASIAWQDAWENSTPN